MGSSRIATAVYCALLAGWAGTPSNPQSASGASNKQEQPPAGKPARGTDSQAGVPAALRGKKLVLKDGTFQLVRDYQRNGERVRYLSAERGDWEEIPAAMVDWDATAKVAAAEKGEEDALAKKVVLEVDSFLRTHELWPVQTVANTIFPQATYELHGSPAFYDVYLTKVFRGSNGLMEIGVGTSNG